MKNDNKKLIAEIIPAVKLPRDVAQVFSYAVPEKMEKKIKAGMIVEIPFRRKNILGVVLSVKKEMPENIKFKLKEISGLPEKDLILSRQQIQLAEFVSNYYYTPLNLVVKTIIPPITKNKARKEIEYNRVAVSFSNRKILRQAQDDILKEIKKKNKILLIHNLQAERHCLYCEVIKEMVRPFDKLRINSAQDDTKKTQTLILFPESFDVYNFTKFYLDRFGKDKIAILTSELTKNQYFDEWKKIKDGSARIIIGTRQAVFAPFQNLKLIIADDEHNSSYKQWDMNPRYHGIKVAEKLAEIWKAKIILSSPAPSIESYYKMENKTPQPPLSGGKFSCHNKTKGSEEIQELSSSRVVMELLRRSAPHDDNGYKNINLIDINDERQKGNYSVLSESLQENLLDSIYKRKQAIIFIPRLGGNTITQCKDCNWIAECGNCGTTLVSYANYLYCAKCQEKIGVIKKCPKCAGQNVSSFGYGSEKLEKEIKELFKNKNIKIDRLDSNTASNRSKQLQIYKDFINKKIDILIGTQMVLKNWNLENLALTAVLFPEIIFNQPEFNSHERSFQFLMSLRNKAGKNHKVIIQSYKPDNDLFETVFKIIKNGDLEKFYSEEIKNRKAISKTGIGYPPFSQLIKLIYKDFNPKNCQIEAEEMFRVLRDKITNDKKLKNKFEIIKPFPASSYKEFNKYRWHIIIKSVCKDIKLRDSFLNCVKKDWIIDVDPDGIL
ncbi:primosomal protein N' [Patescibacteria group bacterium]|nr:primosomal protein N' [Patescibacteria group bacterium]